MKRSFAIIVAVYLLAVLASGCTPNIASVERSAISSARVAIGGLGADFTTIDSEAQAIIGLAAGNPAAIAHAETIRSVVAAGKKEIAPLNDQVDKADKLVIHDKTTTAELAYERTWWISYRLWNLLKWIVAIAGILAILSGVAYVFMGASGPIGMAATVICHTCSLGLVFISGKIRLLFVDLQNKFAGKTIPATPAAVPSKVLSV